MTMATHGQTENAVRDVARIARRRGVSIKAVERELMVARRHLKKAWKAINNDTLHLADAQNAVDRALSLVRR
jgi:hypothetical protein